MQGNSRMDIAVVGSGISGLSAAWLLARHHNVTLYEKDSRLGGHAHTVIVKDGEGRMVPVDTGFMVFNPLQYPNLVQLFHHFNIQTIPTSMSFSVSMDKGAFEFSSNAPDGVFADRENIIRTSFYDFLLEINRFNTLAREAVQQDISPHLTLWEFLDTHAFSTDLREKYVLPLIGSIWSTPKKLARDFPCAELLKFLNSHHLLNMVGHPKWSTVEGGSVAYVERLVEELVSFGVTIRKTQRVQKIHRTKDAVTVVTAQDKKRFDYIVLANHANDALSLLARPTREERLFLSQYQYERNDVYLHSDASLMPRRKEAWASWNYLGRSGWGKETKKVSLTYHMNTLQQLPTTLPIFVTLNPTHKPKKHLTYGHYRYSHPLVTCMSMEMRRQISSIQNKHRTLFCGAYLGYGFHEDGVTSAIDAVRTLDIEPPWTNKV